MLGYDQKLARSVRKFAEHLRSNTQLSETEIFEQLKITYREKSPDWIRKALNNEI